MTLQQLVYIVAIDTHRHFAKAAEACFVSQPTLSMMVQKLESEWEVKIFDRSKQPVIPTQIGERIIAQARTVLQAVGDLEQMVQAEKDSLEGELEVGVIPTLAPYIIPLFINEFIKAYPNVKLKIRERMTKGIVDNLKQGTMDVGILVTPLEEKGLQAYTLFYEEFMVYSSHSYNKAYLVPEDIDPNELWLLEEGHCFRSQIMNLCELQRKAHPQIEYQSGSIETLIRLVERQKGITIIPELALMHLSSDQKKKIKSFQSPAPTRQVSLLTYRHSLKIRLVQALREVILANLPPSLLGRSGKNLVKIT
ncbi:MAG: LysR substrate-binding domain-containing protein [Bacteroidota bacterium]